MPEEPKYLTDEEIARRFREGDEGSFEELYRRYHDRLRRVIYYYVEDSEDAQDIFHDVFVRVYKHIGTYKDDMPFSSWIYQIAVNCSKNFRNKTARNDIVLEREKEEKRANFLEETATLSAEEDFIRRDDVEQLRDAVMRLKEKFRVVFLMRHDQKLKYSEISKILKCSERTVKWRMRKAIETIADDLKNRGII
jgi:RNA polymerase sigma-70 factor (ECF subfamily)